VALVVRKNTNQLTLDPYVNLFIDGAKKQKSKIIKKTLNPTWNEEFQIADVEENQELQLFVYEYVH
jgi:Ca2+-dependent lipid-binding protein